MRFLLFIFFITISVQASARKDTTITYYTGYGKKCGKKKATYYTKTFKNPDGTFGRKKFSFTHKPIQFASYKTKDMFIKHGPFVDFKRNGTVERGTYTDNVQTGKWTTYDEDGNISKERFYTKGIIDKEFKAYENGVLIEQGEWNYGKKIGVWKTWFEDGSLSSEINFVNGKKQGEEKSYYESGALSYVSKYDEGKLLDSKCYEESGEEIECDQITFPDVEPQFPGGEMAMMEHIQMTIQYPMKAVENNEQGIVYVQFVVNKDGSIEQIEVMRSVSESLDAEAIRVIESMPKWIPGTQRGKPVRVRYTVPIHFRLG